MLNKYIAEFIGTFALSLIVLMALAYNDILPIAVPLIAALTLTLFVYSIGPISGCHINPSVTLGQLSIKKISPKDAAFYIVAQVLGAVTALLLSKVWGIALPQGATMFDGRLFLAEMLGALFFNFGIAAVVYGKAKEQMSGVVIGGSLLFGILVASFAGAAGILNPAVAITLNSATILYIVAPIVGAILGVQAYKYIADTK